MTQGKTPTKLKDKGFAIQPRYCLRVEAGCTGIPKTCILNHECYHCAFDQWLDAMEDREPLILAEAA